MLSKFQKFFIVVTVLAAVVALGIFVYFTMRPLPSTVIVDNTIREDSTDTDDNTTILTDNGSASIPTIYVSVVTHVEEPNEQPIHPDFTKNKETFFAYRDAFVTFADMLHSLQISYDWQSDWNLLLAATMFDRGTPSTNNKNFVQYFSENLGMPINPHAHETQYNYADVAALIAKLGVEPGGVVGGYLVSPPRLSKLEYLRAPITGNFYDYTWQAEILWGGGTQGHVNDTNASGVWRPTSTRYITTHDENGTLPNVGTYLSTWDGLDDLLALQAARKLIKGRIYTATVFAPPVEILTEEGREDTRAHIAALQDEIADGRVVFASIEDVVKIWKERYDSEPNVYQKQE